MATPPTFSAGEVLTAGQMNQLGLFKVATATATSGTVLSIEECFTADFDAYRVVVTDARASGATTVDVRFQDGGGVISTNYAWVYVSSSYANSSTYSQLGATASSTFIVLGGVADPAGGGAAFDVFNPFSSANKTVVVGSRTDPRTGGTAGSYNGFHNVAQSVTGLYLSLAGGTITNLTATVYGYRK